MTQPVSLYTCAGGVLEESSDGNKTPHQMLQQIELKHRKDGAVEKGKGERGCPHAPRHAQQVFVRDSLGFLPRGVVFVLTRACRAWALDTSPHPGPPRAGCGPCLHVNPLLVAAAVLRLVHCSSRSISGFLFLVAKLTILAWLLVATHP